MTTLQLSEFLKVCVPQSRHRRPWNWEQEFRFDIGQLADVVFALGIKAKVENRGQYDQYLEELKPLREELGVNLKEDLYPEDAK
jgi:hypothetical protein